jgi:pimeloyl-ACP methyl ester carboxylesterase
LQFKVAGHSAFASTGGREFDPSQPTILFVHGAGNDHSVWQMPARYFAFHGRSSLAIDLPGHGRSGGKPPQTIEDMADWIQHVVDALPLGEVSIAGHSMGALVALAAAAGMGDRVKSLALLGISTKMGVHPELLAAARRNDHLAIDLIMTWGFSPESQVGGNRVPGVWMTGGGERLLECIPDDVLGNDLAACEAYDDAPAMARKVKCPTLVLLGSRDLMTPQKAGHALAADINESRTVVLEGCGHMMLVERPNETLDALRSVF